MVASNDDIVPGTWRQSQVSFAASAGTTYYIAVDGYGGAVGNLILNLNPAGNDDFAQAAAIFVTSGTATTDTREASKEPYEPAHAGDIGGHSVWYRWTAPANGPVDFNTLGSAFRTVLAVYTGDAVTNLAPVAANLNDVGGLVTSRVDFYATNGTTYQIAVDGLGGDSGTLQLNWNMDCRLSVQELQDGRQQIKMSGVDWQRYTLESSGDLMTWVTNHSTITMPGDFYLFTNDPAGACGFSRAQLAP